MCFLIGPERTVMCRLYIYTSRYLIIENFTIRCCLFSLGTDLGQQITHLTFFSTNHYNSSTYIEKPTSLSLEETRTLTNFRYFFRRG